MLVAERSIEATAHEEQEHLHIAQSQELPTNQLLDASAQRHRVLRNSALLSMMMFLQALHVPGVGSFFNDEFIREEGDALVHLVSRTFRFTMPWAFATGRSILSVAPNT